MRGQAVVTISSAQISEGVWRGWGTSLSWFANYMGGLPEEQFNQLMDLLFNPSVGLGLNIVRYNIGGGRNATNSPGFDQYFWHAIPGFKPSEAGPYDWTADERQRRCLLGAKSRGADTLTAVSFSAPWWATVSGDVSGSTQSYETNLAADKFDDFADYVSEVVRQYASNPEWGVTFSAYEPMNEPSVPWRAGAAQESCYYSAQDKDRLFALMADAFKSKGLSTQLVGFDEWAQTAAEPDAVDGATLDLTSHLHVHGYVTLNETSPWSATEGAYSKLREKARSSGKEVWMSEWTFIKHAGDELDLGLVLARNIIETVNFMGASAYVFWQVLDGTPRFSLVWVKWDPNFQDSYPHVVTKKFWVLKHFTQFAPPGSFPLLPTSTTGCEHCVTAFYDPKGSTLTVFVVNQGGDPAHLDFDVAGFRPADGDSPFAVDVYRTSASEDFARVDPLSWTPRKKLAFDAPGRSVSTLVFPNAQKI